jgi:tetratricopeptide (TPR) repeat protein
MYRSLAEDPIGCLHTYIAALQAGVLLIEQGRYDDAKAMLKPALLSPYPLMAQEGAYRLSIAEIKLGEKQSARHRLTALAEAPDSQFIIEASAQLGDLDADDGDLEGALRHYSDVRDRTDGDHPLHTLAKLGAAIMLVKLERGDEAYPVLVDLCDNENPIVSAQAHMSLGYIYRSRDRFDLAAREFQAAIQAEPNGDTVAEAREALTGLTD